MNWLFSIVRIAGASFPVASSLIQLQSEMDSQALSERVAKLEDPVSHLHEDVPELSRNLYRALKKADSARLYFDDEFYKKFSRALAILESEGCLTGEHSFSKRYHMGIRLMDPSFIMYLCALEENPKKMELLINTVDKCQMGESLNGHKIKDEINLPLPVINSAFEIFESKGYGTRSREIGSSVYLCNV